MLGLFLALGVGYIWATNSGYLSTMLDRMTSGDFSTGRFELWRTYSEYIFNNPITLLLGEGLGATYFQAAAPHNTYLEIIYLLGLVGGSLLLTAIVSIAGCRRYVHRRSWMHYSLCGLLMVMAMALNLLVMNDFIFYTMLAWMSMNIQLQ